MVANKQTASDGLNDPPTSTGSCSGISQGKHLITLPVQGTSWSLSCTLSATSNCTDTMPVGAGGMSAGVGIGDYTVQIDPRSVEVSCPLVDTLSTGGSQYRYPPLTGPVIVNVRQPDGTLRGDTVAPLGDGSYTYGAFVNGDWSPGTTYHWYGSISNSSANGNYAPLGWFTDAYLYHAFVGKTDHVFLSMYDGKDQAEATGNYYMYFHYQYEPASWPPDGPAYTVSPIPDPEVPTWPTYPWELPKPAVPLFYNDLAGDDVTIAPAGFKDVDGGLDLGKEPVALNFGFTYQPEDETSVTKHLIPNPPVGKLYMTWPAYRPLVNRKKGHLDQYGTHGYIAGHNVWREDEKVGWDIRLYIPQPVGTAVAAPPANWNP